jgi:hypothetical protein
MDFLMLTECATSSNRVGGGKGVQPLSVVVENSKVTAWCFILGWSAIRAMIGFIGSDPASRNIRAVYPLLVRVSLQDQVKPSVIPMIDATIENWREVSHNAPPRLDDLCGLT